MLRSGGYERGGHSGGGAPYRDPYARDPYAGYSGYGSHYGHDDRAGYGSHYDYGRSAYDDR